MEELGLDFSLKLKLPSILATEYGISIDLQVSGHIYPKKSPYGPLL